jgi:hypothetical protein
MSIYEEQKEAINVLDQIVKKECVEGKNQLNINAILYEINKRFSVGENILRKKIKALPDVYPMIKVSETEIWNIEVK